MWKSVIGYGGKYEVSDQGFVRSMSYNRTGAVKELKPTLSGKYLTVKLVDGRGRRRTHCVHVIIAEVFVGLRPSSDHEVCHINGHHCDNKSSNLCWGTHLENQQDMVAHGHSCPGSRNGNSKLVEADIVRIRKLYGCMNISELSRHFGVSRAAIRFIINRETWRHVA